MLHKIDSTKYGNILCITSTMDSKLNGTPKGFYSPISKLHYILTEANLLSPLLNEFYFTSNFEFRRPLKLNVFDDYFFFKSKILVERPLLIN